MRVIRHLERQSGRHPPTVLTLGNFDGVHIGHQAIVRKAVAAAQARGERSVALTFHPHPATVLFPERAPALLQSLHDRLAMLRALGVELAVLKRFTRAFAGLDPEAFVRDFLLRHLALTRVVVGYSVNFGRDRAGSVDTLRALGAQYGFDVEVIGPVEVDGEQVSSSALRRVLQGGDMVRAGLLLGRPYTLRGRVVVGERRGRALGFPTANLHLRPRLLLPPDGVYAVRVPLERGSYTGVLNVGVRPTFAEGRRTVEVHLLDFDGDLYGRWLTVEFVERLRGEMKFAGPEALGAAIAADIARARSLLAQTSR